MATVTASLRLQPISSLSSSSFTPPSSRPLYLKFQTSHRENLIPLFPWSNLSESRLALPVDNLPHILSAVNFLKSEGISDEDFPPLVYLCTQLFSPTFSISETDQSRLWFSHRRVRSCYPAIFLICLCLIKFWCSSRLLCDWSGVT